MADTSCSDSDLDRCIGGKNQKDLILAGSKALLNNLPQDAVANYKSALEKMNSKANQKIPIGHLVLRYALCIALIKCNGYKHFVDAIENLRELVDSGYASKLPALYLALAKAYFALNRFKTALEYIEKGLKVIQSNSKAKQHTWPGLQQTIEETGKDFLQKALLDLKKDCKNVNPPDAVCAFDDCIDTSDHIVPAPEIYFTDPDFKPFYYLLCDAKCKFAYHSVCWEHLHSRDGDFKEPRDLLGTTCPTARCAANINKHSVIVEVFLIGSEGFDNPLSKFCLPTPKVRNVNNSTSSSSSLVSSNGSSVKYCVNAESQLVVRPSRGPPCSAVNISHAGLGQNALQKNPIPVPITPFLRMPNLPLVPRPLTPAATASRNAAWTRTGFPLQQLPLPSYHVFGNTNAFPQFGYGTPFPCQAVVPVSVVAVPVPTHPRPRPIESAAPPVTCVEVFVRNTSVLSAGSSLVVPVSPEGGLVQLKHPLVETNKASCSEDVKYGGACRVSSRDSSKNQLSKTVAEDVSKSVKMMKGESLHTLAGPLGSQSSGDASLYHKPPVAGTVEEPESNLIRIYEPGEEQTSVNHAVNSEEKTPSNSVVEDFKNTVWELAGRSSFKVNAGKPKQAQPCGKSVVEEFKTLVHGKANDTSCNKETMRKPSLSLDINMNEQRDRTASPLPSPAFCSVSVGSTPPSYSMTASASMSPISSPNHLMTEPSTFQAKPKQQPLSQDSVVIPHSIIASFCSPFDDVRSQQVNTPDLTSAKEAIEKCRAARFGYLDHEYVNPELQCFGRHFDKTSAYVEPGEIEIVDQGHADFVFSYYQSVFDKDGIHRIEDLQEAWTSTLPENLGLPKTFTERYTNVAEFLLCSEKFAAIDDVIGTSDLLPDMYSKAQAEITESVKYLLFENASNPHNIDYLNHTPVDETWSSKVYGSCDSRTYTSSIPSSADNDEYCSDPAKENFDGFDQTGKDNNDNAIFNNRLSHKSNALGINGELKTPDSKGVVYMSDDDEEIEASIYGLSAAEAANGASSLLDPPVVSLKWNAEMEKPEVTDCDSQTDNFIGKEAEKLLEDKAILLKEINELKYEKTELHQRIEQMEKEREHQETHRGSVLQQIRESHEASLQKITDELKEIQARNKQLDEELRKVKQDFEGKESQISDLEATLNKIRRTNAKEMNNFVQSSRSKEEEFQNLLRRTEERNIQLWMEFCEYKIKKFNSLCNDRINVLSQLKEMMSDSLRPSKTDIKSFIEKYEEEMITVALKSSEVNEMHSQLLEKLRSGNQIQIPSVIELPDLKNIPYPPEGAFDYLLTVLKPKQDDFGVSRNVFPQGSRFYPRSSFTQNGLQTLSQPRESEGFPSIFSQQHNETSHLWNNFSAPTVGPPANGPLLSLQGYGAQSPLIQPSLNLMPSMMSYQQNPQSSSVQAMMAQNRTTPSPSLPFSPVNGTYSSTSHVPSVIGSKPSTQSVLQKPAPHTVLTSMAVKGIAPAAPGAAAAPAPVLASSSQGAVPKARVQTATAAMTPIVPSKPVARPLVKGLKAMESNYEKLMRNLQKMFPTRNDMELTHALKTARDKNGNTLSSLTHSEIVAKVEDILNKQPKHATMGWEKFGKAAWGTAKAPVLEWEGTEQDECCICITAMAAKEVYTLECKHAFHKECIRKWLLQDSVCPNCRTHSTMLDEFPPLG